MRFSRTTGVALACVAVMAVAGCNKPEPPPPPGGAADALDPAKVEAEVMAAIKTQVDAYAARDPVKAASILAPDLVTMFHGEANVVGLDPNLVVMKAQMADPAMKLEVSDESVDVAASGDMAVYSATYLFTFTNPATKQPATEVGNWVAVFRRQPDGTMKLSQDIISDAPAP